MTHQNIIYHERQESALCGQHCLNNLLQGCYFSPGDLAEIAQELDRQERDMMLEAGLDTNDALKFLAEDSGNVDVSGNFSFQVLSKAIERSHDLQLNNAASDLHKKDKGDVISLHEGFILNRSSHWFTVRKLHGRFWNLNSMLDKPEVISDFYLSTLLTQLQTDGYDVFIVSSKSNRQGSDVLPSVNLDIGQGMGRHFKTSDLLSGKESKPTVLDPWANLGNGNVLNSSSSSSSSSNDNNQCDEDEDMAAAIAMSLSDASSASSSSSSRELPSEAVDGEEAARIMIRGPKMKSKLVRKFRSSDQASYLFDWIDANHTESGAYELIQMNNVFKRHELVSSGQTFKEVGLAPSSALMIKYI